jgi:hypothetical protein
MKRFSTVAFGTMILVAFFLATGCDIQKAIDNVKNQNIDFFQGIYDGNPSRGEASLTLAKSAAVSSAGPSDLGEVIVTPMAENLLALMSEAPEIAVNLSGSVSNNGGTDGRLYVFFSPSAAPGGSEAVKIGSVILPAGGTLEFKDSAGFDQSPEEVQANLKAYFDANAYNETVHVLTWSENSADGAVVINSLKLDSSPAFSSLALVPADFADSSAAEVKDIVSVSVSGTFANHGAAPARFTWMVRKGEDSPTFSENLIIDITLDPGATANASNGLVVPDGLRMLKSCLKELADNGTVRGNLVVTSADDVNVNIRELKVEFTAKVGF